ncbi:MAG: menaquinone biosynthesis protein [Bacteroidales bacterium]|nr:menaquinone biosynthesis protein [Bacteroidales bacterium]
MDKIKVSAVSFINTYPFIYGLENTSIIDKIILSTDTPSDCAKKLINNEADIGLIPIAEIKKLNYSEIISDYCIASDNKARSVILISNQPIHKIKTIYLDNQSETSNNLVKILSKNFWKTNPEFKNSTEGYELMNFDINSAAVLIGDRTFKIQNEYPYIYDLAEEWNKYTNLPFVFACWVANKQLPDNFKQKFIKGLEYGINHITKIIEINYKGVKIIKNIEKYYFGNMNYHLDEKKRKAMRLFFDYLEK